MNALQWNFRVSEGVEEVFKRCVRLADFEALRHTGVLHPRRRGGQPVAVDPEREGRVRVDLWAKRTKTLMFGCFQLRLKASGMFFLHSLLRF